MGVLGLTSFVGRSAVLTPHKLHDEALVVDGNSIAVQLFLATGRSRAPYGGDYNTLSEDYTCFFQSLLDCGIKVYVLFDGGYQPHKFRTVVQRLSSRIQDAGKCSPNTFKEHTIFPYMLKDVLIETLSALEIDYVVCEWEADSEIAAVAQYLKAPVISYDSDYFIYNVHYVPINHLELVPVKFGKEGKLALKCNMYFPGNFQTVYKLKSAMLPLFGTLLGNDYVKRSWFSKFFRNISITGKKTKSRLGQSRIQSLINFLRHETYDSALSKILNHYKLERREKIRFMIEKSCSIYTQLNPKHLTDLNIENDVEITDAESDEAVEIESETDSDEEASETESDDFEPINADNSNRIKPTDWIIDLLKRGDISPRFYDALNSQTYVGLPQVEDVKSPDAQECCFPILRYNFDLLSRFEFDGNLTFVGRRGLKIAQIQIERLFNLPDDLIKILKDDSQPDGEFFYAFVRGNLSNDTIEACKSLPSDIQLLAVILAWLRTRKSFTDNHVYSIMLSYMMLTIVFDKIGRRSLNSFNRKYASILKERTIAEDPETDCIFACNEFLKYFDIAKDPFSKRVNFNRSVVHGFAQFQACFQQMGYLNMITSRPFEPCSLANTFNGTFAYNMCVRLSERTDPKLFLAQAMKSCPSFRSYFDAFADAVCRDITDESV